MKHLFIGAMAAVLLNAGWAQADRPPPPDRDRPPPRGGEQRPPRPQRYSLEQAISDKAQLHTLAFSGLAFLTGDFGADTFLPPGKVSDYFGFQYMRDIDAATGGHSTSFLTNIAENVLRILNEEQKSRLQALAEQQQADIRRFALMRLPMIKAFRENLSRVAAGQLALSRDAVVQYSQQLYELDGQLSWERSQVMAAVLHSLSPQQRSELAQLKFGDSRTWPAVTESRTFKRLPHGVDVAIMTYASEMFSWWAGSVEADTYFCPERHGMYFGGFGMKTAPAIGKKDYAISTALTGDSGEAFIQILNPQQRQILNDTLDAQRADLKEIVDTRRAISMALRRSLQGQDASRSEVLQRSRRYGQLDGDLSYLYAMAFARINATLSPAQRQSLQALRNSAPGGPKGPFLYSDPLDSNDLSRMGSTQPFFTAGRS